MGNLVGGALGAGGVTLVGIAAFGIATARANVLPRWAAVLFALGLPFGTAISFALELCCSVVFVSAWSGLGIFGLGLIRLGHALWAHARVKRKLSKRLPELSWPYSLRSRMPRTGFADKTVWDWLQLLVVPIVLAIASF